MNMIMGSLLCGLLFATCASGAAYKEGKTVLEKEYKVDIVKMCWGSKEKETDRVLGTARLYISTPDEAYAPITLTFDVYSKKAVTNAVPSANAEGKAPGVPAAQRTEKLGTIDVAFDFRKYGYKNMKTYVEGEFCVDLPRNPSASRLELSNVRVTSDPVTYKTSFNINSSLQKTSFTLYEPKVIPQTTTPGARRN